MRVEIVQNMSFRYSLDILLRLLVSCYGIRVFRQYTNVDGPILWFQNYLDKASAAKERGLIYFVLHDLGLALLPANTCTSPHSGKNEAPGQVAERNAVRRLLPFIIAALAV